MTQVIKYLWDGYQYLFHELPDPRIQGYAFTGNPIEILLIVGIYFKIVLDWGPKFMKNREAFDLKYLLMVYNIFQICFNAYIAYLAFNYAYIQARYSLVCEPVNYTNDINARMLLKASYLYYISKIFDLFETFFFVLRKKWRQISFLHLFHHGIMCIMGYIGANYVGGGHSVFSGLCNASTHLVMYIYYLLSMDKQGNTLWWKKHVTQLQIIQFVLIAIHWIVVVVHPGCGYPKIMSAFSSPTNFTFLVLFSNFYYHSYIKVKDIKTT